MKTISCVGVAVLDALSGPLEHYPTPRLNTQVTTKHLRFQPGGGAVNTASALARMGLSATLFTKVGDDPNGAFLLYELEKCGVDTSGVCVSKTEATPFTFVGMHPEGERTFIHTPGTNKTFSLSDMDVGRVLSSDYLLYQDLWAMPGLDAASGARLLAEARARGVVTLLDECWGFGPEGSVLERMLPYCDYFLPSLDDLRALREGASAEELADWLLGMGVGTVVVKMGALGCLVAWEKERVVVEAYGARVLDTTGAGDCWDAGFIAGLVRGEEVVRAARIGNACAAFCIEAIGGACGVPSYDVVRQRATS